MGGGGGGLECKKLSFDSPGFSESKLLEAIWKEPVVLDVTIS